LPPEKQIETGTGMRRLKKWIDEIRAENKEYAANNWMCRYSSDTVEFIVHPHVIYHADRFKHTVIRIGMILTRLSKFMDEVGYLFHIQTFPSLEDLKIVASLRLNVNLSQGSNHHNKNSANKPSEAPTGKRCSSADVLNKRARRHNLDVVPVSENIDLPQLATPSTGNSNNSWYLVGSSNDNPFTWLHTGFYAEELFLSTDLSDPGTTPLIISGPELKEIQNSLEATNPPAFIHACIAVDTELLKSKNKP